MAVLEQGVGIGISLYSKYPTASNPRIHLREGIGEG